MANILDLLLDYKNVKRRNPDISMLYIAYQTLLMVSSILTPGTIFLMIIGAINLAFPALNLYWCLLINIIPIVIFLLLIFFAKSDTQVKKSFCFLLLLYLPNLNFGTVYRFPPVRSSVRLSLEYFKRIAP